jgi:RHS repeat-associated protein
VPSGCCASTIQPVTYTYGYDGMARPVSMVDNNPNSNNGYSTTWAQNVQYDFAGRLTNWQRHTGGNNFDTSVAETLGYNVNGQLTSMSWSYQDPVYDRWGAASGIQYVYSASQNNGQITQAVETWSGQNISYQYDALKRLISAASTPTGGGAPAAWTETMQYDGFGNLTAKVLNGTATSIPVNGATNRLSNASYDANGNMISGAGATLGYDEANRIVSAAEYSGGTEYYAYAPDGKRMFRMEADGVTQEWTFWGARGEKLGTFAMVYNQYVGNSAHPYQPVLNPTLSFAGRTIWDGGKPLVQDRIGTNRATGARYYPFGDEITSTANDAVKFGTYHRDGFTGLDYADQRYYASTYGRFSTADPAKSSAKPGNPGTWNRYAYASGDPVNKNDPTGLYVECDDDSCSEASDCDGDAVACSIAAQNAADGGMFSAAVGGMVYPTGVTISTDVTAIAPGGILDGIGNFLNGLSNSIANNPFAIFAATAINVGAALEGNLGPLEESLPSLENIVVNLGGEGEVPGAINQQGPWILQPTWASSQAGQSLSQLQQQGNQFVISSNTQLPFANGSVGTVITNNVPIGGSTWLGPGVQPGEVFRILQPGGTWINNGTAVPIHSVVPPH